MAEHLEICTKQEIRCVYQSLGYEAVLLKDEMEQHVSSNIEAHSRLTLDSGGTEYISKRNACRL